MQVNPPKYVMNVLNALVNHGYSAYLVGGCVRDLMLDTEPNDWDITSSALPEQILKVFPDSLTVGMKHGTITVKQGKDLVEVTTFRLDGDYADHRHPDNVCFVDNLDQDLARRDFTINAMVMDSSYNVIDPFHGKDDLSAKIIRAVGVPDRRFEEDALRMFRAFRFSSRLGFEIEKDTLSAIYRNASLASALSAERVRDELLKVLLSVHPEYIETIIGCGLLDSFLLCRLRNSRLNKISELQTDIKPRLTLLCLYLKQDGCIDDVKTFLQSLKLDNATVKCVCEASEIISLPRPVKNSDYKRFISKYDLISVQSALQCIDVLENTGYEASLESTVALNECCRIKDLDIKGTDIMSLGFGGKAVGAVMNALLEHVIDNPDDNRHDILMSIAETIKEK